MTETVFASVSEAKIKNYVEERKTGAKKALFCVEHFDRTLTTLLVGNNIVNTALSTFALTFFMGFIRTGNLELISTAIITIVLLIFGEITPSIIFSTNYLCNKLYPTSYFYYLYGNSKDFHW